MPAVTVETDSGSRGISQGRAGRGRAASSPISTGICPRGFRREETMSNKALFSPDDLQQGRYSSWRPRPVRDSEGCGHLHPDAAQVI